ncbi:Glutathione S-transferase, N-terminal [Dillenia turbinata]|uniref:Glutathione S-transferase, N-terminal n=1 Tax=Dillenia turbinata TaxID=194707 RepID=A0AAN8VTT6_9MAGN
MKISKSPNNQCEPNRIYSQEGRYKLKNRDMAFLKVSYSNHSSPLTSFSTTNSLSSTLHLPPTIISSSSFSSLQVRRSFSFLQLTPLKNQKRSAIFVSMATQVQEVLPPVLDSTSDPPAIFDGTTKLYISYTCPYAQRVWITRNVKGLQDKIKLVPIDLQNRPAWYKEKVYPPNKVPSLEHNDEVKGESLDLIKYLDCEFDGPKLLPDDPAKKEFADELLAYTDTFNRGVMSSFKGDVKDAEPVLDYIEKAFLKFGDGPFFLGHFSLVDIAYAPFIERYSVFLLEVKKYDIAEGRPKLAAWIEVIQSPASMLINASFVPLIELSSERRALVLKGVEHPKRRNVSFDNMSTPSFEALASWEIDKIEAYKITKPDPKEIVEAYKKRFLSQL